MDHLNKKGRIFLVGIGGIGMSGIAEILHNLGYEVTGSDQKEGSNVVRLKKLGIKIKIGHNASNIKGSSLIVYSSAIKKQNVEISKEYCQKYVALNFIIFEQNSNFISFDITTHCPLNYICFT